MEKLNRLYQLITKELRGVTIKDECAILLAILIYVSIRISLRLFMGKEKRNKYVIMHNLKLPRFLLYNVTVNCYGFLIRIRKDADDLSIILPNREPEVSSLLHKLKEDDIFVNIGANIGAYILFASQYVKRGRIIAIEAHPQTCEILNENVRLNKLNNVECINVAVSDHDGSERLYINKADWGGNSIIFKHEQYIDVKAKTLDSIISELNLPRIDWLLIDTEGAEVKILKGAERALTITNNIIVEVHTKENFPIVMQSLKANNFNIIKIDDYVTPHLWGSRANTI